MDLQNMDLQGGSLQISTEVVGKIARCAALAAAQSRRYASVVFVLFMCFSFVE